MGFNLNLTLLIDVWDIIHSSTLASHISLVYGTNVPLFSKLPLRKSLETSNFLSILDTLSPITDSPFVHAFAEILQSVVVCTLEFECLLSNKSITTFFMLVRGVVVLNSLRLGL